MSEIKELTGVPPLTIESDGSNIIDWSMTGTASGVGNVGINYLKMEPVTVNDGLGKTISYNYFMGDYGEDYNLYPPSHEVAPIGSNTKVGYQQWMIPTYGSEDNISGNHYVKDGRTENYNNCFWFADLKAGTYKLICEYMTVYLDSYNFLRYGHMYRFGYYYFLNQGTETKHPHVKLITPNNTVVLSERLLTDGTETATTMSKLEEMGYIPGTTTQTWFYHEEFTFTVGSDMKLGFFAVFPACARFMITDTDVTANKAVLDTSIKSCWEPYQITIPLSVNSTGAGIHEVNIILKNKLYSGDTITMTSTGITIPTYHGRNKIYVDTPSLPTLYLRYVEERVVELWSDGRPYQVSVYDMHEAQSGFDHNGLAILMPYDITSYKEDKGRWDLTMKHPIDPYGKWTYIAGQNIIKVNGQLFRIDQLEIISEQNKELVQAHANHISYDLRDYWIEEAEFEANTGESYITQLANHRVTDFPNQQPVVGEYIFDITSDIQKPMRAALKDQSFMEAIYGADNSLASRYGGEIYRNNFHLSVNETMENAPSGLAFNIRYGTDMTKINFKIDYSDWITNLICVDNLGGLWATWYGGEYLPHHHKTKRVHFTYEALNDAEAEMQRLIADGEAYWATVSVPTISIELNMAYLKGDPKYKDFLNLQNVDVGYTGKIYVEHLGIDIDMKVTSIKRNELTGEILQVKLGNNRRSLIRSTVMSQTIVSPNSVEGKNVINNQTLQEQLFDTQTSLMNQSIAGMELFRISDLERRTITQLEG